MKLKEIFGNSIGGAANLGMSRFRFSSDKEKVMSPHQQMSDVYDILETRPALRSGLTSMVMFLLNDIGVSSTDKKSSEFMNEWLDKRPRLDTEISNFVFSLIGVGTAYMQPTFSKRVNGTKVLNNVQAVPNSGIIYVNMEAKDDKAEDYWLMEVPVEVQKYDGKRPEYRPVWYIKGSRFYSKHIWCIPYKKSSYDVAVFGHSMNLPHYGFGLLNSCIDNEDTQREIIKNWALQAKYRALGKKIIGFYNTSEESVSLQELEDIKEEFQNLEEEDNIIVNKRFDQVDLSFNGQDSSMETQIDWLRKDSGSSMVPSYMGAFSQDSSMATAAEAKIPFSLKLKSIQPIIIDYLNNIIIKRLKETYSFLADDLTFTLATPELYSRDEVFNMMTQLYNTRACTFNELRKSAGLESVEGGNSWGSEPPLDNTRTSVSEEEAPELKESVKDTKAFKEAMKEIAPKDLGNNIKVEAQIPKRNAKAKKEKTKNMKESVKRLFN